MRAARRGLGPYRPGMWRGGALLIALRYQRGPRPAWRSAREQARREHGFKDDLAQAIFTERGRDTSSRSCEDGRMDG